MVTEGASAERANEWQRDAGTKEEWLRWQGEKAEKIWKLKRDECNISIIAGLYERMRTKKSCTGRSGPGSFLKK